MVPTFGLQIIQPPVRGSETELHGDAGVTASQQRQQRLREFEVAEEVRLDSFVTGAPAPGAGDVGRSSYPC